MGKGLLFKLKSEIITIFLFISGILIFIGGLYKLIEDVNNNDNAFRDCLELSSNMHIEMIIYLLTLVIVLTILMFRSMPVDLGKKKDEDKPDYTLFEIIYEISGITMGFFFIVMAIDNLKENYINIYEFIGFSLIGLSLIYISIYRLYNKNHYFKI